jgi:hypothetical protein
MSEFGGKPENIYSHGVFRTLTRFGREPAGHRPTILLYEH